MSPIGNDAPFVDSNGDPLTGGLLYWYVAGSSTPQDTYTTSLGNVANANPVVLGSNGYPTVSNAVSMIWLTAGVSYKAVLKTSAGVTLWTRDEIDGINDTTVTQDQWVSGPAPTYISATSFSLVGDQTSTFQVGRRVKTTNSGGTVYSTISASAFAAVTTVTVVNDSGTLDAGLSAVSYGLLSATNTSVPATSILRAATYQWTDWDPADVAGTDTNAPSTAAASSTAPNYITMANSSGTVTFTFTKAGNYFVNIQGQNEMSAAPTGLARMLITLGGTATRYITPTAFVILSTVTQNINNLAGSMAFMVSATAGQTLTVLPSFRAASGGVTTNFTSSCAASAAYMGA